MPHIDFAEAFAEEIAEPVAPSALTPAPDFHSCETTAVFIEPSRFRTSRLGRSEWANIVFAGITIAGGLFCAFYFFNGAELVRAALAWPGEYLYPRPVSSAQNIALHSNALPDEAPLPGTNPERRFSKTDPTGDPFPRVNKLITLDRSLGSLPRNGGAGLTAGSPPPLLPPPVSGPPVPPGVPGVPGVPGGPVGGLPGPGTLISRLTLLVPGGDSLTQSLQKAAATVPANLVVTLRHETSRVQTAAKRVVKRVVVVRPSRVAANDRGKANSRGRNITQGVMGSAQAQPGTSNSLGSAGNSQDRINTGTGAVSVGGGAGALDGGLGGPGGVGGAGSGALGGIGGGLRGTISGTVGAVGGALGGGHGGGGGLLGGGGHH